MASAIGEDIVTWSRAEPNGVHFLTVRRYIKSFLDRQKGCQLTISKIKIFLRKKKRNPPYYRLELDFSEIHEFMVNLGATSIEEYRSNVNPHIYDISKCR